MGKTLSINRKGNSIKMKKKFSTSWISSKQTRKQRKYLANAPLHIRKNFMSANLSEELREKISRRNVTLRKGDKVKIMRGEFKNKTGKVNSVDLKKARISIEGLQKQKKDGTKVNVYFHPSNVQIIELMEGKKRNLAKKSKKEEEDASQKK